MSRRPTPVLARAELERRRRESETLRGFMERRLPVPPHLAPFVDALSTSERGLRIIATMPPGAAKSTALRAYVCRRIARDPGTRVIYASYSTRLARHHVRDIRAMLLEEGVRLDRDGSSTSFLRTDAGGYVASASLAGGLTTGLRADLVVVDDVFASRLEAESVAMRDRAADSISGRLMTRLEPATGDFVMGSTRWHTDDPIGRLLASAHAARWQLFEIPAITPEGASFWPERFPLEGLLATRDDAPRDFQSLYMGQPLDDGGQLFRGVTLTAEQPPKGALASLGLDCGYTARTSSDPTVALALAYDPASRTAWVLAVEWMLGGLEETAPRLAAFSQRFGGSAFQWAASGTEAAVVAPVLRERRVPVHTTLAVADKVSRAQRVGGAWCEGRVLVPRGAPFADRLVRELLGFPSARHDDAVDALASAYDAVAKGTSLLDGRPIGRAAGTPSVASQGWLGGGDTSRGIAPTHRPGLTQPCVMEPGERRPAPRRWGFL